MEIAPILYDRNLVANYDVSSEVNNFGRVVVYFKAERMGEARPVDFIANDRPATKTAGERP